MAAIYTCDRCGALLDKTGTFVRIGATRWQDGSTEGDISGALCMPCANALREWFTTPPRRFVMKVEPVIGS